MPDTIKEAIQIANPAKNIAATMFHDWDYRRGCITNTAIKRMQENLETDSSLQSDSDTEPSPKKRRIQPHLHDPEKKTKKIQACLLSLCEEPTWQETRKNTRPHPAHPPAARTAAATQAQPLNLNSRFESQTKEPSFTKQAF